MNDLGGDAVVGPGSSARPSGDRSPARSSRATTPASGRSRRCPRRDPTLAPSATEADARRVVVLMYSKGPPPAEGEHNTWNQPDLNQLDWDQAAAPENLVLTEAIARLVPHRSSLPHLRYRRAAREGRDIVWLD